MSTKILIADGLAPEGSARLKATEGIELLEFSNIDKGKLRDLISTVDILVVRSKTRVDRALMDHAKNLKVVLRAGIGLDNVEVEAATELGIVVMNAPTGNIVTTAEHALAMMFAISRHIPQADASIRLGKWEKSKFQGHELRGKCLGVVGLGNVGNAVADRAIALEMKVIAHDPFVSAEAAAKRNIGLCSLEELLSRADYVTIHVPLIPATKNLIQKKQLGLMKRGSYLINCARGGIVDERALVEALDEKRLAGAAFDVFETEPLPAEHPFLSRRDVILTPHLGASTDEAQVQVSYEVADQLIHYIKDGVLKNTINVPNITLEQLGILKPYLTLCERLGSFAGQTGPQNIRKIKVHYEGTVTQYKLEILTLAVLKGFLAPLLSTSVNFVNARKLLKERGIRVEESIENECEDYSSFIKLTVEGSETLICSGTIFGKSEPRIVSIDDFAIDAVPSGYLLFTKNMDQPGVIGAMGTLLASQNINIARMHLGRDSQKIHAISLINVDSKVSTETLELLRKTKGMLFVKQIEL